MLKPSRILDDGRHDERARARGVEREYRFTASETVALPPSRLVEMAASAATGPLVRAMREGPLRMRNNYLAKICPKPATNEQ